MNQSNTSRVAVTGIGMVTPLGLECETSWQRLIQGFSGITRAPAGLSVGAYAPVADCASGKHCRPVNLATLAADEAWSDAGLNKANINPERVGCTVSMSKPYLDCGAQNADCGIKIGETEAARILAQEFNIKGPVTNITAACATGATSIIIGSRWIKEGVCDIVLAGATESSLNTLYLAGFANMGVLAGTSKEPGMTMRPFDAKRCGFVVGEGAGILSSPLPPKIISLQTSNFTVWVSHG